MPDSIRGEFTISEAFPSSIAKGQSFSIDMTLVKLIIDDGGTSTEYPNATLKADDYSISTNSEGKIVVVSSSITDNRIQATFRALGDADYSTIDADEGFRIDILLHAYISELALDTVAFTYSQPITLTDDGCVVKDEIQRCVYRPMASGAQDREILFIRDASASDALLWRGLMDVRFLCEPFPTWDDFTGARSSWQNNPELMWVEFEQMAYSIDVRLRGLQSFSFSWQSADGLNKLKSRIVDLTSSNVTRAVIATDFANNESGEGDVLTVTASSASYTTGSASLSSMSDDPRFPAIWSLTLAQDESNMSYLATFSRVMKDACVWVRYNGQDRQLWGDTPQIRVSNPSSSYPSGKVCIAQRGAASGYLQSIARNNGECRIYAIVCLRRRLASAAATSANVDTRIAIAKAISTMSTSVEMTYENLLGDTASNAFNFNFSDIVGSGYVLCNAQGQAVSCSSLSDAISKGCLWNGYRLGSSLYALVVATVVESQGSATAMCNLLQKAAV